MDYIPPRLSPEGEKLGSDDKAGESLTGEHEQGGRTESIMPKKESPQIKRIEGVEREDLACNSAA